MAALPKGLAARIRPDDHHRSPNLYAGTPFDATTFPQPRPSGRNRRPLSLSGKVRHHGLGRDRGHRPGGVPVQFDPEAAEHGAGPPAVADPREVAEQVEVRSEEHTSELQSL